MRCLAVTIASMLVAAGSARAQESGRVGITMGYPASVGVIWHVSERVAVRPEISFQQISSTATSSITAVTGFGPTVTTTTTTTQSTTDQWVAGYGASALVYLRQGDALRTYVSPRFQYTRSTSHGTNAVNPAPGVILGSPSETDFTSNNYFVSGSFGAQYSLGEHFAVFGEVGFSYTHQRTESSFAAAGSSEGHTIGTRSGAGVILYVR